MSVIRQRILENMQKFSRAMIGAVLFLPVIGLILALSSVLTNPTLISETSFLHQLGQLLGGSHTLVSLFRHDKTHPFHL